MGGAARRPGLSLCRCGAAAMMGRLLSRRVATHLPLAAFASRFRALDATQPRETLMIVILFNATAPVGCAPDLARFRH